MAKVLKAAAVVVGVVALAVAIPGVGAAIGGALGTTAATVSAVVGIAAVGLNVAAAAFTKTTLPATTISGNQSSFTASLDQGLPWVLGRTRTAGCAVHDITYDAVGTTTNDFQSFFGVWSADRCYAVEATQIDNVTIDFSSPNATAGGSYQDWMWHRSQLGLSPEASALKCTDAINYPPGWSTSAKLSGMTAFSWTLRFDPSGAVYPGGTIPQKRDIIKGALAYDPRKDSTYPGGSGSHRADDESTWEWTENPFLLGLKWARGIFANGKKKMGIGMALAAINVDSAVQAANVADANDWKVGGVVYSTDPKYDVLKKLCAAGSGEPIRVGGMLHFLVDAPKVSLDTITTDDLIGKCTAPSGTRMKDRINGVIPTFRSPDNDWQLVPATKVTIADYVTADGRPRTKAMTWELVQSADQVATLATYAICNAREIDGIVLPCKVRWIGYKPGDAVTVSSSVVAMDSQLVVLRKRSLDPATGAVTFTARTETTAKHAFALAQTTTPPPTPALATVDRTGLLNPGVDAAWTGVYGPAKPEDNATVGAPAGTTVGGSATTTIASTWDDSLNWSDAAFWEDGDSITTGGLLAEDVVAKILAAHSDIASIQSEIASIEASSGGDIADLQAQLSQSVADLDAEIARAQGQEGTLHSLVVTAQSTADGNTSAISTETTQRAAADGSLSARVDSVTAAANSNSAAITSESATRATADSAISARVDSVVASAGGSTAAIDTEASTRASADTALSGRIDTISASTSSALSQISSEAATRSSQDAALAATQTTLTAQLAGSQGSGLLSTINNNATVAANATGAAASQISSLSAALGSVQATVSTQSGALADVQGKTATYWQVIETFPSGVARIALFNNGGASTFLVDANMLVNGNLVVAGTVQTGSMANNAITKLYCVEQKGSGATGAQVTLTINAADIPAGSSTVSLLVTGSQNTTSTTHFDIGYITGSDFGGYTGTGTYYDDGGNYSYSYTGWSTQGNLAFAQPPGGVFTYNTIIQLPPGTYTFAMYNHGVSDGGNNGGSLPNVRQQSIAVAVLMR